MTKKLTFILSLFFVISCKKENNTYPVPQFILPKSNYYLGETMHLSVLNPVAGEVFTWEFGDGTTAIGSSVTHQYSTNGSHLITLSNQNTTLGQNPFSKLVNVFPCNASFRVTSNIPGQRYFIENIFASSVVPHGAIPTSGFYEPFYIPYYTNYTDTIFINITDQKTPMYISVFGGGDRSIQFTYTTVLDNTKLYQNQNIIFTDTTMVYYPGYFAGPKIPFGSY